MTHCHKVFICLTLSLCATAALAQDEALLAEAASSPVAYVYVSRPTHMDAFAASSSGKLTPVPGSPYAGISVFDTVVAGKYLYGADNNGQDIDLFSIAANGSLKRTAVMNVTRYTSCCGQIGLLQTDLTGEKVYNQFDTSECMENNIFQSFKVESNGELQFLGNTRTGIPTVGNVLPLVFSGGNSFAYQTDCGNSQGGATSVTELYRKESNGYLVKTGFDNVAPTAKQSGDVYCARALASDSRGHLAYAFQAFDIARGTSDGPLVFASYTANAEGALSTHSNSANMPSTSIPYVYAMNVSPSGKLLAVSGDNGLQIFHFNGASPVTHYSSLLIPGQPVFQMAWDNANHLYALGQDKLYVFTVTPASIQQASGSPYSIPQDGSLSVLSIK